MSLTFPIAITPTDFADVAVEAVGPTGDVLVVLPERMSCIVMPRWMFSEALLEKLEQEPHRKKRQA